MVVELMQLAGVFNVGDFVPWLKWLDPQGVVARMKKLHRRYDVFLNQVMADHRREVAKGGQEEGQRKHILSVLISLKERPDEDGVADGAKLTDVEIKALLLNLFTAGTYTTASTVEWAMAELIRNLEPPEASLGRARLGQDRRVSESYLGNVPFMNTVIKETFRVTPHA